MPSDLTGAIERVGNALAGTDADARFRCDSEWVCADDLRALLAQLDAAEAERDRVREMVEGMHLGTDVTIARARVLALLSDREGES
jgi:hypothetical protein